MRLGNCPESRGGTGIPRPLSRTPALNAVPSALQAVPGHTSEATLSNGTQLRRAKCASELKPSAADSTTTPGESNKMMSLSRFSAWSRLQGGFTQRVVRGLGIRGDITAHAVYPRIIRMSTFTCSSTQTDTHTHTHTKMDVRPISSLPAPLASSLDSLLSSSLVFPPCLRSPVSHAPFRILSLPALSHVSTKQPPEACRSHRVSRGGIAEGSGMGGGGGGGRKRWVVTASRRGGRPCWLPCGARAS